MILKRYLSNKGGEAYLMSIREKVVEICISLMLICLMAFALIYEIITTLKLAGNPIKIIAAVFICCIFCIVILYNKLSFIFTMLLISVETIIATVYLSYKNQLQSFLDITKRELTVFYHWLMEFIYGNHLSNLTYRRVLVICICVIIVFIVYVLTVKRFSFFPLFIVGMSCFVYKIINEMDINYLSFYGFIFACLLYYFKYTYLNLAKKVHQDEHVKQGPFMLLGIILSSFIFSVGVLLSHKAPIELKWVHELSDNIYINTQEKFYYETEDFSLNQVGIGDSDVMLGGNIDPDNTIILEVSSPKSIYLKANSRSIYVDNSWTETDLEEFPLRNTMGIIDDTCEMIYGIEHLSDKKVEDVSTLESIKVTFKNIKTKSLFIPLKIDSIKLNGVPREIILKNNDTLKVDKIAGNNFSYEIQYYAFNYNNKDLEEALRKSKAGIYDQFHSSWEREVTTYIKNANLIREKYCSLPDNLPQRVKDLAYTITKDETNDYDKVKAIETYLAKNYVYTYTPGTPESKKDFVDYFLFDNKQGYCTYFATSMAVLTRCIGLPSRYVEGYVTPTSYRQGTTVYDVTNKQAHAWVEVYFEGFGWVPFEPTAVYRNIFRQDYGPSPVNTGMPDFARSYTLYNDEAVTGIGGLSHDGMSIVIGIVPIVLVINILLLIVGIRVWKKWRLTKINARDAILLCYKQYLNVFEYQKIPINENETPRVFAKRIDNQFQFEKGTFSELTEIFLVARYSQLEIDEEQRNKVICFRKELLNHLKTHSGIPRYLLYRIRKG